MPSIGEKIKKLRLAKKMTQEMLARQLNVTVSAVSQWESGKTMPDLSALAPLCSLLAVSADDLLGIRTGEREKTVRETRELVEHLAARGNYAAAFSELRAKIATYPEEAQLRMEFGFLFMRFCREVDGHEEEKRALYGETEQFVIKGGALERWRERFPENAAAADELFLFLIRRMLSDRSRLQTDELLDRVETLTQTGQLEALRQLVLKELQDAEEIGGPQARIATYRIALRLMRLDRKAYRQNANPALLNEIATCGAFLLGYNANLPLLAEALLYSMEAAELLGDKATAAEYRKTLEETKEALKPFGA